MRLISKEQIADSLWEVNPMQVAVAYVGIDWNDYIDVSSLREIIVSPTIGSNPKAIHQLVSRLGWERVHFLDNLHSKLYIGSNSAAFGSFNLSRNGIAVSGLEEFGAVVTEPTALSRIQSEFCRLRESAKVQYPSTVVKEEALHNLSRQTQIFDRTGLGRLDAEPPMSLANYTLLTDHDFSVAWYRPYVPPINAEAVANHAPTLSVEELLEGKVLYSTFLEEDEIQSADWILLWRATAKDGVDRRVRPIWLHVGDVIPHGVSEDPYTKLVVQYLGATRHNPPFSIDDPKTVEAIRLTLADDDLSSLRPSASPDDAWSLANSRQCLRAFVERLRGHLAKLQLQTAKLE